MEAGGSGARRAENPVVISDRVPCGVRYGGRSGRLHHGIRISWIHGVAGVTNAQRMAEFVGEERVAGAVIRHDHLASGAASQSRFGSALVSDVVGDHEDLNSVTGSESANGRAFRRRTSGRLEWRIHGDGR